MVITQLLYWIIFTNYCICILTGPPGYYFFMIIYIIHKSGGIKNSPN